MQPLQCDLQAQFPKHPITTHTQAHPTQLEATVTMRQKKKANRPQPQPPHKRGTFHRRLQPLYTEKHKVSFFGFLPKTEPMQHHAAITMRSATTDSKTPYNYACTSTPKAARSHPYNAAKKKGKPTAAATAAQTRYLSSPAAATLHGKTQGFVLRLPPQNRALATFMQPFQCDLQPHLQQTHRTTHTGTTIVAKHIEGTKRPQPHPPHTRGTFHRRLQPLYTEKHKVSCSSPQHCPCNIHAAMTMPSACNHPSSRSSLNRTPPFKVKSQSHTTLQGQVSIAQHPSRSSLNPICNHPSSRSCEVSHHPSRSSLNRAPPFKIKSQSHTTLQGQVSIAHHPSRSSLNRTPPFTPPFKVKWSSVNRAPPFLNRAPPFKVKSQSHTTLQGQVSIAHHPSSFQDSEFYLSVPRKYCFPTSFDYKYKSH